MLSGLQRVEILGWEQQAPFRIATIVPQPSRIEDLDAVASAALEVVDLSSRLCGDGKPMSEQLREHLTSVKDPAAISDVVAQTFLNCPNERQKLLETLTVEDRLQFLSGRLSQLLTNGQ
jgi:ATP-dependent Lon protease